MPKDILDVNPVLFDEIYKNLEAYAGVHGVDVKVKKNADLLQDYAGEIALGLNERANKARENDPIKGLRNGASPGEAARAWLDKEFQLELTEKFSKATEEIKKQGNDKQAPQVEEKKPETGPSKETSELAAVSPLALNNLNSSGRVIT